MLNYFNIIMMLYPPLKLHPYIPIIKMTPTKFPDAWSEEALSDGI